jgi:hypothetical protein
LPGLARDAFAAQVGSCFVETVDRRRDAQHGSRGAQHAAQPDQVVAGRRRSGALLSPLFDVGDEILAGERVDAPVAQRAVLEPGQVVAFGSAPGGLLPFPIFIPGHHFGHGHALAERLASGALTLQCGLPPGKPFLGQGSGSERLSLAVDDSAVPLEPDLRGVSC